MSRYPRLLSRYQSRKKRHTACARHFMFQTSDPGCALSGSACGAGLPFRPCCLKNAGPSGGRLHSLPPAATPGRFPGFLLPGIKKAVHSAHCRLRWMAGYVKKSVWRRERDSNPWWAHAHNGFQDRRIRPLCHPSGKQRRKPCLFQI